MWVCAWADDNVRAKSAMEATRITQATPRMCAMGAATLAHGRGDDEKWVRVHTTAELHALDLAHACGGATLQPGQSGGSNNSSSSSSSSSSGGGGGVPWGVRVVGPHVLDGRSKTLRSFAANRTQLAATLRRTGGYTARDEVRTLVWLALASSALAISKRDDELWLEVRPTSSRIYFRTSAKFRQTVTAAAPAKLCFLAEIASAQPLPPPQCSAATATAVPAVAVAVAAAQAAEPAAAAEHAAEPTAAVVQATEQAAKPAASAVQAAEPAAVAVQAAEPAAVAAQAAEQAAEPLRLSIAGHPCRSVYEVANPWADRAIATSVQPLPSVPPPSPL